MDDQSIFLKMIMLLPLFLQNVTTSDFVIGDKLYCRNQNLTKVPSELISNKNANEVTNAIFSHNKIQTLKSSDFVHFSKFPNLKYLFFDHNNITHIEGKTFAQLPNLKFLDLSHNGLDGISNDIYDDLEKLNLLHYVNLKRNPLKKFKNIDKLIAKGVQIDYDGVLGREKKIQLRSRRVISYGSSVNETDAPFANDDYSTANHKENNNRIELDSNDKGIIGHDAPDDDNGDEDRNSGMVHDKPVKAYVVDNKPDQINSGKLKVNSNFLGSIIFNFLAAFLVLVALPISMIIYYFVHRNDGIS